MYNTVYSFGVKKIKAGRGSRVGQGSKRSKVGGHGARRGTESKKAEESPRGRGGKETQSKYGSFWVAEGVGWAMTGW